VCHHNSVSASVQVQGASGVFRFSRSCIVNGLQARSLEYQSQWIAMRLAGKRIKQKAKRKMMVEWITPRLDRSARLAALSFHASFQLSC
jgi:hypothetical protein